MSRTGKPENYDGELDDRVQRAVEEVERLLGVDASDAIIELIGAMLVRVRAEVEK